LLAQVFVSPTLDAEEGDEEAEGEGERTPNAGADGS